MTESLFTRHIKNTINYRIKNATPPEFEWQAILILGTGYGQFRTVEIPDIEFKNTAAFKRYLREEVPIAIRGFRARQAAFIKPVWMGREPQEGMFKPGVLVIQAEGKEPEGWGAYVIRRPDVSSHIGEPYQYNWEDADFDADIKTAFADILKGER